MASIAAENKGRLHLGVLRRQKAKKRINSKLTQVMTWCKVNFSLTSLLIRLGHLSWPLLNYWFPYRTVLYFNCYLKNDRR